MAVGSSSSTLLVLADIEESFGESFDNFQELDKEETQVDYTQEVETLSSYLLIIIFALGVVSGLTFSRIMWGRVK